VSTTTSSIGYLPDVISASADASMDAGQAPAVPAAPAPKPGFFTRMGRDYLADWAGIGVDPNAPAPKRRGTPTPISSPPFPSGDWPIGGTQVIGAPDYQSYPLSDAIKPGTRNKVYGWLEVGANASTSNKTILAGGANGNPANYPFAYDEYSNTFQLDQFAVYFERLADTVQTSHFDWGYRFTSLYGVDYRFTTANGMFSQQLLLQNKQYGFDPVMAYVDLYFPHVAQGMDLRLGRYISLPDIEAQLAPNNYSYTHSILYTVDCYTQTGANATIKFSDHFTWQVGFSPGCDTMPWTSSAKPTGNTCLVFTWSKGGDVINACDNTINDGKWAYNNLTAQYITYYHAFSPTWHTDTEFWYQDELQTPNLNNIGGLNLLVKDHNITGPNETFKLNIPGANGGYCGASRATCYADEWAITNYLEHDFNNHKASLNIRNEFVNDMKGQRTGTATKYQEAMVGFDYWVGSTITFRPELSYGHTYGRPGFNNDTTLPSWNAATLNAVNGLGNPIITNINNDPGTPSFLSNGGRPSKNDQLVLAADLIWHF
jgi:hypothetical protein